MSPEWRVVVLSLHLLATVVWLGGLSVLVLLVVPALNRAVSSNPLLYTLLASLRRRFAPVGNLALLVLIVTGLFQMTDNPAYGGLLRFDNTWSVVLLVKHILIALLAVLGLAIQSLIAPRLERVTLLLRRQPDADSPAIARSDEPAAMWQRLHRQERILSLAMLLLAAGILVLSAWLGVL